MNGVMQDHVEIMVVDDEPSILDDVANVVRQAGYVCHPIDNAEAARKFATHLSPDLIIADINLDGESGLELCHQLKQETDLAEIPVIFLSGAEIPNVIRRAHAAGGTYYLRKPFDPTVLADLIEKALWMPHLVSTQIGD